LEVAPNPEAQFMVGLFYATGLGGVKEDQGKVRLYVSSSEKKLMTGITILYIRRAAGISACWDGFGIQALGGNKRSRGE
jgi:TPR repeat protein